MNIRYNFNKNFNKWFLNDTLKAIKNYSMIADGQKICVALSGGKDSVTLLYILNYINLYSNCHFQLFAAHVKTSDYDTSLLNDLCKALNVPYIETSLVTPAPSSQKVCSICARLKRGALVKILDEHKITTVAFGHHADDVAETLFMNIVNNRKLGSFSPVVKVPNAPMQIIRPMIYLDSNTIRDIHCHANLPLLKFNCPYADNNLRSLYRQFLNRNAADFGVNDLQKRIVKALENVDMSNLWRPRKTSKIQTPYSA